MIIPSIDLQGGSTVQLVGGRERALDAGDPVPIFERFSRVGEVAVIDLDAALGQGTNESTIAALVARGRCRVGGGIRSVEAAIRWLDRGASKVILGTAARPELLRQLPKDRVIAALDAFEGEVVVEGWRKGTGATVEDRMRELAPFVGGFLVTFVEGEGRMGGLDLDRARRLSEASGGARLTVAGGITTPREIAVLDELGIDAQVGMAIYRGALDLADAVHQPLALDFQHTGDLGQLVDAGACGAAAQDVVDEGAIDPGHFGDMGWAVPELPSAGAEAIGKRVMSGHDFPDVRWINGIK